MPAFRKKPVVIEAIRTYEPVVIETLEGDMQAQAGDWIIKGVKGELYPCKDDIFRQTYEPVGKEGVNALTARGPDDPEEDTCVLPFPGVTTAVVTADNALDTLVTDA